MNKKWILGGLMAGAMAITCQAGGSPLSCICEYQVDHFAGSKSSIVPACSQLIDSLSLNGQQIQHQVLLSSSGMFPHSPVYKCVATYAERIHGADKEGVFALCESSMKNIFREQAPSPRFVGGLFQFNPRRLILRDCQP